MKESSLAYVIIMVYKPLGLRSLAGLTMPDWSSDRPHKEQSLVQKPEALEINLLLGATVVPCLGKQSMTPLYQSREDAQELTKPLMTPRIQLKIGNWTVRTMYSAGRSAQAARAMNQMKIQIIGKSECRWTQFYATCSCPGGTALYSGGDDNQHMQGVAIVMTQEAKKALIEWWLINGRIIKARFYSKFIKLTMIHAYAPTNDADE